MINRVQMNNISFKAYRKHVTPPKEETPSKKIIREVKNQPTCIEMYQELDQIIKDIEKADKELARVWKSDRAADETKLMNHIGRLHAHQMLLEQAIQKKFEEEFARYEAKKEEE